MKNLFVLLSVGMLVASCPGVIAAQELLVAPDAGDIDEKTPELAMPAMPDTEQPGDYRVKDDAGEPILAPTDESWDGGQYTEGFAPNAIEDCHMYQCDQALLESTGTWIRRGFWYAEVDAVIFNRKWNRDPFVLMAQPVGITVNQFGQQILLENQMRANGSKPGMEGTPRFTLGHFLFRDHKNRDHVTEFTAYGGGEWSQEGSISANPNNDLGTTTLNVPEVTDFGNTSFDGATDSNFRYDSRFNSFELNYLVKERMGRDRMEMEPSGHWVRRAGPSITRSLLAGVRFFDLNEDFNWQASGIDPNNNPAVEDDIGSVQIHTDNDMIGTQLGFSWMYETARWSGGVKTKGGIFLNIIDTKNVFFRTLNSDGENLSTDTSLEGDEMSFLGEAALLGKWHLRPNFSVRAGLEILFLTSTAVAPKQLPGVFIPSGPSQVISSGDNTYLGGSIGFEGYW